MGYGPRPGRMSAVAPVSTGGLLAELRVLDLSGPQGQLAGRLLADLGATVVKPEPTGGDPVRRLKPLALDSIPDSSLVFTFLNAGKLSTVLDPEKEEDRRIAERLVSWSQVILLSWDQPYGPALVGAVNDLPERSGSVVVHLSPFGLDSPDNDLQNDLTIFALSGLLNISGSSALPPCSPPEAQSYYYGSVWAALAGMTAMYGGGSVHGELVDVSLCEALTTQEALIRAAAAGGAIDRGGSQHRLVAPSNLFRTSDGLVQLHVNHTAWPHFLRLLDGRVPELDQDCWKEMDFRLEHLDELNGLINGFTGHFLKVDLVEQAQAVGVACMSVNFPSEVLADIDMQQRGAFAAVKDPIIGDYVQPASPYLIDGNRLPGAPAPTLGADKATVMTALDAQEASRTTAGDDEPTHAPLHGIRVATFTSGVAGPRAGRILAWLGAEVIKIESRNGGIDSFRYFGKSADPELRLETSQRFAESNLNVNSVTLDLKSEEGHRIAGELIASCDVVLDNYRSGVLNRLGFSDEEVHKLNPEAVVVHMPGFGSGGRRHGYGTWGPSVNAFTGMTALWNHPSEGTITGTQSVYPDYLASVFGPLAVVAGLLGRQTTGRGTAIEYSQVEGAIFMLGVSYLYASIRGEDRAPMGNGREDCLASGLLACAGDDRWCAYQIRDQGDLAALAVLLSPALSETDDMIDALTAWAARRVPDDVMGSLRTAGLPAGTVRKGTELLNDPVFAAHEFVRAVHQPHIGRLLVPYLPVTFRRAVTEPVEPAPILGSSNDQVIGGYLGYTAEEIEHLMAVGAVS